ncbi:MAG TPA: serine/threonine-protein kinase [Streptosporangiaceae bacterium]|nr:serine/threonine-protein kinase [Streptosporangiaceae bacterium]
MTSTGSAMSGMLPLRDMDPREVGGYQLLGRLGEGGQGVVFLAVSPGGSRAAVKLLPPTTDPQVRSRFLKEVAAAQRVPQFCTAQVLDAGIFERRPFIVSEYISGPSLVEVVDRLGPRSGAALERIAVATLTALGAVHAAGMVHRDFKPGNVLLGPDGPVVIDFGLATVPGMTTTGLSGQVAVGTPAFMAPEQLAAKRVTAAADMWSWGVTIVLAGTGKLPFKGESLTATAYSILHSEPDVGRLPEPLGLLVHRCLNKDPAVRPSARDALSELVAAGAQLMGPLPPMASAPATAEETSSSPAPPEAPPGAGDDQAGAGTGSGVRPARRRSGRARRAAAVLTSIVLVAGASRLALILAGHGASPARPTGSRAGTSPELTAEAAARARAITWILQQVDRSAIVSCDPQVCADLSTKRFPAANLLTLEPGSPDPLDSNLVVATAAIRHQYGARLASVYAPAVIASFGSGTARIDILLVFPGGTAKYRSVAPAALHARKAADALLLVNHRIALSATARAQLRSGEIDPRLPLLLAALAHAHPVSVVDFPGQSPGGGPASLLRSVDLATSGTAAHLSRAAYLRWMQAFVAAQRAPYHPAWNQVVRLRAGQAVLRIGYAAPSPLSTLALPG